MPFVNTPGGRGIYGDGSDGTLTFDGSTVLLGITPSGNTYILDRDIFLQAGIIDAGVTIDTAGFRIFCKGRLTVNGTIQRTPVAGLGDGTAGTITGAKTCGSGTAGGAGQANGVGAAGTALSAACGGAGGAGGAGGSGTGGAGGAVTVPTAAQGGVKIIKTMPNALMGVLAGTAAGTLFAGGCGGGGGGSQTGSNTGGGGGAGGGVVIIVAKEIAGSGSIFAKGGAGATPTTTTTSGGGGGGGGGVVVTISDQKALPGTITVSAAGGAAGSGGSVSGSAGVAGTAGLTQHVCNLGIS